MTLSLPVFIGGTGRCGTTQLKEILGKHQLVSILKDELRVIADPGGAADLGLALSRDWTPYQSDKALKGFIQLLGNARHSNAVKKLATKLLQKIGLGTPAYLSVGIGEHFSKPEYGELLRRLLADLGVSSSPGSWVGMEKFQHTMYFAAPQQPEESGVALNAFFSDLYSIPCNEKHQSWWVDDTPYSVIRARAIYDLFPGAKFIHLIRDPRDVIASYGSKPWGQGSALARAKKISHIYRRWSEEKGLIPEESYLELRLEDFVRDPHEGLGRILSLVGLKINEDIASALDSLSVEKAHIGRWRKDLDIAEQEQILPKLVPWLDRYGYSP